MPDAILVTRAIPDDLLTRLRAHGDVVVGDPTAPLAAQVADTRCRAILCQLVDRIDRDVLTAAPLRVVSSVSVGLDHVDLDEARDLGIEVCNTPGVLTAATADLAFALLLATARRITEADRFVRDGSWRGWEPGLMLGLELEGATLGIVGFGRIGQAVARRARGFGMRVVYAARSEREDASDATFVTLDELCRDSDIISLHVPGTDETSRMFDAARFGKCKPGVLLINTARGSVVDEQALVDALGSGRVGGAGLDVFDDEPHVHPGLLAHPRVVVAPHIGSATGATRRRMAELAVENLIAALD